MDLTVATKSNAIVVVSHKNIYGVIYDHLHNGIISFDIKAILWQKLETKLALCDAAISRILSIQKNRIRKKNYMPFLRIILIATIKEYNYPTPQACRVVKMLGHSWEPIHHS